MTEHLPETENFQKFEVSHKKWPTWQVLRISLEDEKPTQPPPPSTRENTPPEQISPKSPCGAIPSKDVPANSRTRRMARDEETQKSSYFARATSQVQVSLTLTPDISLVCCTVFVVLQVFGDV